MIIHDAPQGSEEWHDIRMAGPTASRFKDILTPTGKLSKSADGYMAELLVEWAFGMPVEQVNMVDGDPDKKPSIWMVRGTQMEADAVAAYEMANEVRTSKVGFVTTDDLRIGGSPDRLVGDAGLLEIKCPKSETHMEYMLAGEIDPRYKPQVQGQLWICEREWNDWTSYFPGLPLLSVRVVRDEPYIAAQRDALNEFCDRLDEAKELLIQRFGDWRIPPKRAAVDDALGITEEDMAAIMNNMGELSASTTI